MEISKAFISIGRSICEEVYGVKHGHAAFVWVEGLSLNPRTLYLVYMFLLL
jgi:hypothetical protein